MIMLDKPLSAYSIQVVFKCEEIEGGRKSTTIFSVESAIWGKSREAGICNPININKLAPYINVCNYYNRWTASRVK